MSTHTKTLDALRSIYEANAGELTPKAVVEASRPEDAPLHDRFEWDDSVAGEKYREVQAAQIIRSVHIPRITDTERGPVRVRAFLAIGETDIRDEGETAAEPWTYVAIDDLSANAMAAILRQMEKDVAGLRRKYRDHRAALDDPHHVLAGGCGMTATTYRSATAFIPSLEKVTDPVEVERLVSEAFTRLGNGAPFTVTTIRWVDEAPTPVPSEFTSGYFATANMAVTP